MHPNTDTDVKAFSKVSAVSSEKPDRHESTGNRITEINFTLQKLDKFDGQIISAGIASEIVPLHVIRFYSKQVWSCNLNW